MIGNQRTNGYVNRGVDGIFIINSSPGDGGHGACDGGGDGGGTGCDGVSAGCDGGSAT